jgi:hypothetical protein
MNIPFGDQELKAMAMIAAGSPPDVGTINAFPKYAIKNMIQPIEPYFDLNDPVLSLKAMQDFKFRGRYYGFATFADTNSTMIYYNKQMFKDNGLTTPTEYYKKGQWNFKNFRKVAMALTQDTNGDGKIDQYGFSTYALDAWGIVNGGKFVNFDKKGGIQLTLNDTKLQAGLQFVQDGFFKYKYMTASSDPTLENGKLAMTATYCGAKDTHKADSKWGVVPFPLGPGNTTGQLPGGSSAFCIYKGAKNPQGAAAFIYYDEKYYVDNFDKVWLTMLNKDQLAMYKKCLTKVRGSLYQGIGNIYNIQWPFWGDIEGGKSISATCIKYAPVFQKEIDLTLKDTHLPNITPFKGVPVIDFENGKLTGADGAGTYGVTSAAITNDPAEVISGNSSLKIVTDAGPYGGWQALLHTNPAVIDLPPYHTYKISFDYKALSDPLADGSYYIVRYNNSENAPDGWNVFGPLKKGDKGHYECTVTIGKPTTGNMIELEGYYVGTTVVDNIKITEQ